MDTPAAEPAPAPPVEITVRVGGVVVFTCDLTGRVAAAGDASARSVIEAWLAFAAARLATLRPAPETPVPHIMEVCEALASVGTPEAVAVIEALGERATSVAEAFERATAILTAAIPTAH